MKIRDYDIYETMKIYNYYRCISGIQRETNSNVQYYKEGEIYSFDPFFKDDFDFLNDNIDKFELIGDIDKLIEYLEEGKND